MAVESPEAALIEARQAIADFPRRGSVPLLREAINEAVSIASGLSVIISDPSRKERQAIDTASEKGVPHLLVYSLDLPAGSHLPPQFSNRLSMEAFNRLDRWSLRVQPGWRIYDSRKKSDISGEYEDDQKYLGKIIEEARRAGDLALPEDLDLEGIPHESRRGLIPSEIERHVIPKAESLLEIPKGSMDLPSLREAMVLSLIYGFVPLEIQEWQLATLVMDGSNRLQPIGLRYSHHPEDYRNNNVYYTIRKDSKHRHNPETGFRLVGQIPQ